MADTITLWTRQVPQVWAELRQTGAYHVRKEYIEQKNEDISDYYLDLYRWYTKEARKRKPDIPEGLEYPIWLSVTDETMLQPTEDTIVLKLEVPRDKYIACNMDCWGYRVNYWYIPKDEKDKRKHEKELERYGIHGEEDLIMTDKGNFYPVLRRKIIDSWERVFTIEPKTIADSAATVWELELAWVKEVQHYGGTTEII